MVRDAVQLTLSKRRLIFVTGKGGVGKSTVAGALGRVGAGLGLRTIVVELAADDGFAAGGREVKRDHERELAPNLFAIAIDPQTVMEEYLRLKLPSPLASLLARSRLFGALSWATPGLRELLAIGKVWELAQPERTVAGGDPFDLVIVDAPASGHGVGVLRAPRTFAQIAKVGPVASTGAKIDAMLHDSAFTSIVAVTTPEEIPVNETVELARLLTDDELTLDAVIVNARLPERFSVNDEAALRAAGSAIGDADFAGGAAADHGGGAAIACALSERVRASGQEAQIARLGESLLARAISLPLVVGGGDVGNDRDQPAVAALAVALEEFCG